MFYRNAYLFYGKEGGITIFCACIKARAGLVESKKRNIHRFEGEDFLFRLTKDEAEQIRSRSQIVTLNKGRGSNIKYLPFAFTESMLFHKTAYSFLASKQGQDLWTLGKSR